MILLMVLMVNMSWGQSENYVFELGLSYDDAFVKRFNNENEARKHLTQLVIEVNEIFTLAKPISELKIIVKPRQIRKISGLNHTNHFEYHKGIAQYWTFSRKGNDLCFTPDIVHHITGLTNGEVTLGHAHTGGPCNLFQKSMTGGASHTRFDNIFAIKTQAYVMVRSLLHQVGLGKENCAGMPSGKHCLMTESLFTFNENNNYQDLWMSTHSKNTLQGLLNSADLSCLLYINQQADTNIDAECQTCDGKVLLSSQNTKYINELDFSCLDERDPGDCSHAVHTTFNNSCDHRIVKVEVYYNDHYIDSISLPEGFSSPVSTLTNDYNKIVTSRNIELTKGATHSSIYKMYFNGNTKYNITAGQNGTAIRVRYVYVSGIPFTSGIRDATYRFLFPYKIDKRGQKTVFASEIKSPEQNAPYNFCSGIRHDIYIENDGELRFDYPATFCNAHFIMGENSKIIIEEGNGVIFENCTFRTSTSKIKWNGIELEVDSKSNFIGNTRIYSNDNFPNKQIHYKNDE